MRQQKSGNKKSEPILSDGRASGFRSASRLPAKPVRTGLAQIEQEEGTTIPSIPLVKDTFFISIDLANKTEDDFDFLLSEGEVVFRCFMDKDLLNQSRSLWNRAL
jgi:hypothetical protein